MRIIIEIGVLLMNLIYCFHKIAPVKNRITFISRQSNEMSIDASLLFERLNDRYPDIETRAICMMIPPGISGKIKYLFHMIGPQMHAIATSKVVVLEGYSIPVSILRHKKSLKVLQMWHALGIFKKFGRLVEGEDEGYNKTIIEGMRMHKNYDAILCSSEYCRSFYAQAFGYPDEKVIVAPLPRVDLLKDNNYQKNMADKIFEKYPELRMKKNILYAPTHRKGATVGAALDDLIDSDENNEYNFIVKLHPIDRDAYVNEKAFYCQEFSSFDLLAVADYVVTDYSAFVFEAVCRECPVLFYAYDIDLYLDKRGFCIDYLNDMPSMPQQSASGIFKIIRDNGYDLKRMAEFKNKFIEEQDDCTDKLVDILIKMYNS